MLFLFCLLFCWAIADQEISILACDIGQQFSQGNCSNDELVMDEATISFTSQSVQVYGSVYFPKNGTVIFQRPKALSDYQFRSIPSMKSSGTMFFTGDLIILINGKAALGQYLLFSYPNASGIFNEYKNLFSFSCQKKKI